MFAGLVARRMPALSEHMESLCVHPLMYVTQWFMCGFTSLPLWDTVLSIWDIFMLQGEGRSGSVTVELSFKVKTICFWRRQASPASTVWVWPSCQFAATTCWRRIALRTSCPICIICRRAMYVAVGVQVLNPVSSTHFQPLAKPRQDHAGLLGH